MTRKLYESAEQHHVIDNLDTLYQNETNSTTDDLEVCESHFFYFNRVIVSVFQPNTLADLELRFYECALHAALDIVVFIGAAIVTASCMQKTFVDWRFMAHALMLAYYGVTRILSLLRNALHPTTGNVFVVLSIVWRLHYFVSYVLLTRLMVFCAHVQSTRGAFRLCRFRLSLLLQLLPLFQDYKHAFALALPRLWNLP